MSRETDGVRNRAVTALLLLTGLIPAGCADTPPASPPAAAAPEVSVPVTPAPDAHDMHHHDEPSGPAAPPAAAPGAAAAFAAAWVRRDLPPAQWHAAISGLCEPGFAQRLSTVDPQNLPADQVTGDPKPADAPAGGAVYTVATNGGTLTVTLIGLDGRWLVTGNDFTRDITGAR